MVYCYGQDTIFKKNKDIIQSKVLEITEKSIRYKLFSDPEGAIFTLPVTEIQQIRLSGGTVIQYNTKTNYKDEVYELTDREKLILEKQKSYMVDAFSPLFNHLGGGYQWLMNSKIIGEIKAGYIGIVKNQSIDNEVITKYGLYVTPSLKLKTDTDFVKYSLVAISPLIGIAALLLNKKRKRLMHPLNSSYLKPQLSLAYKRTNETVFITNLPGVIPSRISSRADFNNYSIALNFCLGHQMLIADFLLLDYFLGMGYGFYEKKIANGIGYPNDYGLDYYHSHFIITTRTVPLTLTMGISFGILAR